MSGTKKTSLLPRAGIMYFFTGRIPSPERNFLNAWFFPGFLRCHVRYVPKLTVLLITLDL